MCVDEVKQTLFSPQVLRKIEENVKEGDGGSTCIMGYMKTLNKNVCLHLTCIFLRI